MCVCVCVHRALKLHDYRDCIHNIRDGPDTGLFFFIIIICIYTNTTRGFTVVVGI